MTSIKTLVKWNYGAECIAGQRAGERVASGAGASRKLERHTRIRGLGLDCRNGDAFLAMINTSKQVVLINCE